nr:MAG TPA: hypothetical protein [Bacteriophage sp.]
MWKISILLESQGEECHIKPFLFIIKMVLIQNGCFLARLFLMERFILLMRLLETLF